MTIWEKYKGTNILEGSWLGLQDWDRLQKMSDEGLLELIPYMTVGSSQQMADAKRETVIAILNSRSASAMLGLTKQITWLTYVLAVLTIVMAWISVVQYRRLPSKPSETFPAPTQAVSSPAPPPIPQRNMRRTPKP